jgi:hypothetical protein
MSVSATRSSRPTSRWPAMSAWPLASASIALGRRPAGKLANRLGAARLVSLDADSVTV